MLSVRLDDLPALTGDVVEFELSPDSSRVVYLADQDADEVYELYSVAITGGAVTKLNGPLVSGGDVGGFEGPAFRISPDSSRVVYGADQDADEVYEIYSVAITGGPVTKLNGPLATGGDVWEFAISPDSSRVVYLADQATDEVAELYSVAITGVGGVIKLNGSLVNEGDVSWDFEISPDSSRVVYLADQETDGVDELYSVWTTGGTAIKLNESLVTEGDVSWDFEISPDSSRVVYRADRELDEVYQLYSVAITGGPSTKLNEPLVSGRAVNSDFAISPDSSRVVYGADQDEDEVYELYSVAITGGDVTKLNGSLVDGGDVWDFQISADSSRVVYLADQDADDVDELYSVAITGVGGAIKLNGSLPGGGDVNWGFQISPDGSRVVYRADQDADGVSELYSVAITGGDATKLNGSLVFGGDVWGFEISPDGDGVVYRADQETDDVYELYSVAILGGGVTKLNGSLVDGGDVDWSFEISADGKHVVYGADQDTDDVWGLYAVLLFPNDLGDAPSPYPTTQAEDGALHEAIGPTLGTNRDTEADGQPTAAADGDDTTGTPDDEDGVTFGSTISVGQLDASLTVNVQNAPGGAKLDAWIDFNTDGCWGGPFEQIADSVDVTEGDNPITFDVPSWAVDGTTYARFRLSTDGDLGPGGPAVDGEVEDYLVVMESPPAASAVFGGQNVISDTAGWAQSVFAADVDGDGDMDVLGASYEEDKLAWYENDGSQAFTTHYLSGEANGASSVFAADVDGDGDMDVLSASSLYDTIAWYENDGSGSFTPHTISILADSPSSVFAADVDGDGDTDVLVSQRTLTGKVAWYENDGDESFTERVISTDVAFAASVFAADVDTDGDLDVLSASPNDDKIVWFENDGSQVFTEQTVSTASTADSLFAADVDGDGDMDVLTASYDGNQVAWYANNGSEVFTELTIATDAEGAHSVFAADVDRDGDVDVLAALWMDNTIAWYENNGFGGFTEHIIIDTAEGASSVFAADVDGDGDLDALSASHNDDTIAWYESATVQDYGDAPDPYPTLMENNGARHLIVPKVYLGYIADGEADGQPSLYADGDDLTDHADEDGVWAWSFFIPGEEAEIRVDVTGTGYFSGWIDLNRDGDWDDAGEQIFDDLELTSDGGANPYYLTFDIPSIASGTVPGPTYARCRFSTQEGLSYDGPAPDGEVEDYNILLGEMDFGDAPEPYPTWWDEGGAAHGMTEAGPWLGDAEDVPDAEIDGQPWGSNALADDEDGNDDEDGTGTVSLRLAQGETTVIPVIVNGGGGYVQIWIDFDGDAVWDSGEQVFSGLVDDGQHAVPVSVPADAIVGQTFARYRISSQGGLEPTGWAPDGEVEDHAVTIEAREPGDIYGVKVEDLDGDGELDIDEPGLEGWTIFLDEDFDGVFDPGEMFTTTDANGNYSFTGLDPGVYTVTEVLQDGWAQTFPRVPSEIRRVSVHSDGTEADWGSEHTSINADGRYVAFHSLASNLVDDDTNDTQDVFVYDRQDGSVERVSVHSDGSEANSGSHNPAINADGRYVAFESNASNLVTGDANDVQDIFVYNRQSNTIERVSVASDGSEANGSSDDPSISADARYVAFASEASNLVDNDTNDATDVFVYDRQTGTIERVSVASGGSEANGESSSPSISADGRYVAFWSEASNLVPGDTNDAPDVFVYDRQTGIVERVSVAHDGSQANGNNHGSSLSADARYVAFWSDASNLVPDDTNVSADVFVYERETGIVERVSVDSDGNQGNDNSYDPSLSADGRYVAFCSFASNLVPGDTNEIPDVFVYDRDDTGSVERVNVASDGSQADFFETFVLNEPSLSADGRYVAFASEATNLVPGDTNGQADAFVTATSAAGPTIPHTVVLGSYQMIGGINFGNVEAFDFGDAPPEYPTPLSQNGAYHAIGGPWLGGPDDQPDWEPDGQPDPSALGDDNDKSDDENGLTIPALVQGQNAEIQVEVNGGGYVQIWIDFNGNSSWEDAGEQVFNGFIKFGTHTITVDVPASALAGTTFVRARISTDGGLESTGFAPDGEVEDHEAVIQTPGGLAGVKWADMDGDGVRDAGEPGLEGWTIFVDEDGDGEPDDGERTTTTDAGGAYSFADLAPGEHTVAEVPQAGWTPTTPQSQQVVVVEGQVLENVNFGNDPTGVSIDIEKHTNGEDADAATGPMVPVGNQVTFTYEVTNTGLLPLVNVTVTDDNGTPSVPGDDFQPDSVVDDLEFNVGDDNQDGVLDPNETWEYSADAVAEAGQYENLALVGALFEPLELFVSDEDLSHHYGVVSGIVIEKSTNDQDADTETGPLVAEGSTVEWTYRVFVGNDTNVLLEITGITDDNGTPGDTTDDFSPAPVLDGAEFNVGDVNKDGLIEIDEVWRYRDEDTAQAGQYGNLATVTADDPAGETVTDDDPSHYFGVLTSIDIEKATNGEDADDPTGPVVPIGDTVTFTYLVTNTGNQPLADAVVTDDNGTPGDATDDFWPPFVGGDTNGNNLLDLDETWEYTAVHTVTAGQYRNVATVMAWGPINEEVSDEDPSHHLGDPLSSTLSGVVYVDSDDNAEQHPLEPGIPGVIITLTGTTISEETTMTAGDGSYLFEDLPAGIYTITETHPIAFMDGQESLGTIDGIENGTAGNDVFTEIDLGPDKDGIDYKFGELGLHPDHFTKRHFLAKRPPIDEILREAVAEAAEEEGDAALAAAIRTGSLDSLSTETLASVEMDAPDDAAPETLAMDEEEQEVAPDDGDAAPQEDSSDSAAAETSTSEETEDSESASSSSEPQIGYEDGTVSVTGTDGDDHLEITPQETQLVVTVNGHSEQFPVDEVDTVTFDGGEGSDTASLTGSAGNDEGELRPGSGTLQTPDFEVRVDEAEQISVDGGGGVDRMVMYDSPGSDRLEAAGARAALSGDEFLNEAWSFDLVWAISQMGGDDEADEEEAVDFVLETVGYWMER